MANGTKQQWRDLSQQMRENTTPRELGEAVLALAQGKRAAPSKTDYRIWIAVVIGAAFILSIGVSREVVNARALSAQVEEITEAHAEASEQARIAEEARAEAEMLAGEKTAWQEKVKSMIREFIVRARAAKDEESPTDAIIALRIAGDFLQASPIDDESLNQLYDGTRSQLAVEFVTYLFPDMDVNDALALLAQETIDDGAGRSD